MMSGFRELLRQTKQTIVEIDPGRAEQKLRDGAVFLDVRENDEIEQGAIPESVFIARGHLESQVESRLVDKTKEIVVVCAAGVRSVFAAATLEELGYENVSSMKGGFNQWKDENRYWEVPKTLTSQQRNRYQRHLLLPEVGEAGQQKLLASKVLLLGAGGLGSPVGLYLAAAGVGTIGIVDMDVVDESNLQRQILHNLSRVGTRKVDSAKETLTRLNSDVNVIPFDVRLDASNIEEIISGFDVIVDGADNFPVRYMLNEAYVKHGIQVVHGSIFRFEGQVTVFEPRGGVTYRDMLPEPPPAEMAPSCSEAGVLGVLPGLIGTIQAVETVKLILGVGDLLTGRYLTVDTLDMKFREFKLRKDPHNPITWENRERIQVVPLEGHCMPAPLAEPQPNLV